VKIIVIAYTDGSCLGNGKTNSQGGFGVVITDNDKVIREY
jgi:ribonuclease HI